MKLRIVFSLLLLSSCASLRPSPRNPDVSKYDLGGRWQSGIQTLFISCYGRFELDRHDDYEAKVRPRVGRLALKPIKHAVPSSKYSGEILSISDSTLTIDAIFQIDFKFQSPQGSPSVMKLDEDLWQRVEAFDCR